MSMPEPVFGWAKLAVLSLGTIQILSTFLAAACVEFRNGNVDTFLKPAQSATLRSAFCAMPSRNRCKRPIDTGLGTAALPRFSRAKRERQAVGQLRSRRQSVSSKD